MKEFLFSKYDACFLSFPWFVYSLHNLAEIFVFSRTEIAHLINLKYSTYYKGFDQVSLRGTIFEIHQFILVMCKVSPMDSSATKTSS
jgi:hypothetical protein